jgi:hypothetical protein|tara:strand:+ start:427 stop:741 length:315 start_codon:yes stop_codon:yes gene_type:complete
MKTDKFNAIVNELDSYAQETMNKKGPEYTMQDSDVLNNFKSTAKKLGVDPLVIWYAYFDKQISSVAAHVSNHDLNKAEPMISRFGDIINYAKLGYALFIERDKL